MSHIKLHPYQEATRQFVVDNPYNGLFLGMGLGKTLTTLTSLLTIAPAGHVLVIAPLNIARSTWQDEIDKWDFAIRTKSLVVGPRGGKLTRAKRLERYAEVFTDPPSMYFINQELVEDLVDNLPKATTTDGKRVPVWPFATVVVDESQGFKNPSSKRFKALRKMRPQMSRLTLLTGTPTPNGLLDLWSQINLLDGGAALGRTMTEYKQRWFHPTKYINGQPTGWEPNPGAEEEIYAAINHLVVSVENTAIQLPPFTLNDIKIHLSDKEMAAYDHFKKEAVLDLAVVDDKGGEKVLTITAANAAVLASKLTQFASGTIYTEPDRCSACSGGIHFESRTVEQDVLCHATGDGQTDDDLDLDHEPVVPAGGDPAAFVCAQCSQDSATDRIKLLKPVPVHDDASADDHEVKPAAKHDSFKVIHERKIEMCDYILRNTPSPVIIAYRFVADRKQLHTRLKAMGHDVRVFDGSPEMIRDWNDGKIGVLLLQPASAGHGLNLQYGGSTMIWYTLPDSLEQYAQTVARLYRQGQTEPVVVHRLITAETYDERLPKRLEKKHLVQQDLIDSVRLEVSSMMDDVYVAVDEAPDEDYGAIDISEMI